MTFTKETRKGPDGLVVASYIKDGKPYWIAKEIGAALGYSGDGRALAQGLVRDWAPRFAPGDTLKVEGDELRDLSVLGAGPLRGDCLLLSRSGMSKVLVLTRYQDRAVRLKAAMLATPDLELTPKPNPVQGIVGPRLMSQIRERQYTHPYDMRHLVGVLRVGITDARHIAESSGVYDHGKDLWIRSKQGVVYFNQAGIDFIVDFVKREG